MPTSSFDSNTIGGPSTEGDERPERPADYYRAMKEANEIQAFKNAAKLATAPIVPQAKLRGEALCDAAVIYGAEDRAGVRQGKIMLEQLPDRSALRLRVIGFDSDGRRAGAEMLLDDDGYQALAKVFQGYGEARIERPQSKKDASERVDEVVTTLNELSANEAIPIFVREAIAGAAMSIVSSQVGPPPAPQTYTPTPAAQATPTRRRMDLADLALPEPSSPVLSSSEPEL